MKSEIRNIIRSAFICSSILVFSPNLLAVEVTDMGDNWTRYTFNKEDFRPEYGSLRDDGAWHSGLSDKIRSGCMLKTSFLPVAGNGEMDVRVIHKTNAYIFANSINDLTEQALFGLRVENENGPIIGEIIAPGSASEWNYALHSTDGAGTNLYNVTTIGFVGHRISEPFLIEKDKKYRIGICPVLEMTDVGIQKIIIDVRLGLQ